MCIHHDSPEWCVKCKANKEAYDNAPKKHCENDDLTKDNNNYYGGNVIGHPQTKQASIQLQLI